MTVQGLLDALQATRDVEWTADQLRASATLRRSLEAEADHARFVKTGDLVRPFTLAEVDGGQVVLTDLLADGPAVLIFFRFADCPACNTALSGYHLALAPHLHDLGVPLVAISPQIPEKLVEIKKRHDFGFLVASDREYALIDAFGIGFDPDDASKRKSIENGHDLSVVLGNGRWTLPYPTVVVIDRDRVVRFADVHPNWMVRTEATTVLNAVRPLLAERVGSGR
ncbi:peroxiredoxin-like family protein [Protofrankia symbiont of Coriaria ruscifolia]|uniref:peroxiredoxin-like family protein n=1 Tax=Protofrankia symbiont of Coriaria ruscifolia TaxID=1306542 RepID=UPI001041638B|nr:peroxiredoxin-like family protein [Protofrankia symbiont of Coriaria ruscifolia]